jgi:hypothetical protein
LEILSHKLFILYLSWNICICSCPMLILIKSN